jgi:dihydroorotase
MSATKKAKSSRPLLIRGGTLLDPANQRSRPDGTLRDLLIADGRVSAIDSPGKLDQAAKKLRANILDATGLVVAPGLIDLHVHLREPGHTWKETIATGTAAAAAGGFTAVCCMPNTVPVNDSPEWTRWIQSPDRHAAVSVFPVAAATIGSMGEQITDYPALKSAGAVAVSDDGKPILGDAIMFECLRAAAFAGLPVIQHAEDTRLTGGCSMHDGPVAFRLGLRGYSVEAESDIVARDIKLLEQLDRSTRKLAHLHVAHLSTAAALEHVRAAKKRGLPVTCEVAPHHFTLTHHAVGRHNTHAKMYPPLRTASDVSALIDGLLDGTVDCIATDHAPHSIHEKEQEFDRAPNGITGLETALGLTLGVLHRQHGLSLSKSLALLTSRPAAIVGLEKDRGHLAVGARADILIFDPAADETFLAANSRSLSRNSPFDGWPLPGAGKVTLVAGVPANLSTS